VDVRTGGGRVAVDLQERPSLPFTESYAEGAGIIIEAIPSFGYVFTGWEGHISSKENPEYIVMDCNKQVTAGFAVDWRLIGTIIGSFILLVLFTAVLFTRCNAPETVSKEPSEKVVP